MKKKMRKLKVVLTLCSALVFVSTVRAQVTGTNNAELNGDYAFTFNGISGSSSGPSSVFAAVGRFTADGAGNLTNGELDTNGVRPGATRIAQTFIGTYAIGADHRGVMNIPGVAKFAFAMMANGNAQFIEFDAAGGSGTIGSGTMEKVDTTAYGTAKITGPYAFGVVGLDHLNHRAAGHSHNCDPTAKRHSTATATSCGRFLQRLAEWQDGDLPHRTLDVW